MLCEVTMPEQTLPTDQFSRRMRELSDNPGAVRASSTVNTQDFYGNAETWVIDTFRVDGDEEVFLQRMNADGGQRFLLPPDVTDAMNRQRDRVTKVNRSRGARVAMAKRVADGHTPAFLRKEFMDPEAVAQRQEARKRTLAAKKKRRAGRKAR